MKSIPSVYEEPSRKLPVLDHADVLVVGGGPGGIGAAIAAARNGARTILIERFDSFGGMWTSGILSAIMPFPFVRGIFAEVIESWKARQGWSQWTWRNVTTYGEGGTYDSEVAKRALDEMILDAGVIPYFFTQFAGVIRTGNRLDGVIVESKEGRQVIWAKQIIDASGDGDVCANAGVPFEYGREFDGAAQPMSMIFKMSGIDTAAARAYQKEDPDFKRACQLAKQNGELTAPQEGILTSPNPREGEWNFNTTRILGRNATKVHDVTEATIEARRQVEGTATFVRKYVPGFQNAVVSETAHIGVRESRRITADYTVTAEDIIQASAFEDCIARGDWYIDIHNPTGAGTKHVHPPEGKWYEIPYRSIRARGIDNLLIASRCIDSTHEAHAAIRITPQVMAIGQGAGTAAALCVKQGLDSTRQLDAAVLRETLRSQGAFV